MLTKSKDCLQKYRRGRSRQTSGCERRIFPITEPYQERRRPHSPQLSRAGKRARSEPDEDCGDGSTSGEQNLLDESSSRALYVVLALFMQTDIYIGPIYIF